MTKAATDEVLVDVPLQTFWEVVADAERYPEFVPGIKSCRVREVGGEKHVDYDLDLGVKRLKYTLRHEEHAPGRLTWSLVSGDWMKVSSGSWELSAEGAKTRARYTVEIQVAKPPLVPQAVVDRVSDELSRVSLPRNLAAFKKRAESLKGRPR
jgi:ribosome-associated toxin RatA of RatAB toxin-antitoxin module